jgi:hypothetical protein
VNIKGELFNQDMVKAFLEGRKARTSRPIKPPAEVHVCTDGIFVTKPKKYPDEDCRFAPCEPKYQVSDIVYGRETWCKLWDLDSNDQIIEGTQHFYYKANDTLPPYTHILKDDGTYTENWIWNPSLHMPREAARLWFRVTDVKVQNITDMSEQDAVEDGFVPSLGKYVSENMSPLENFKAFWGSQYGTDTKWMWAYYLQRISKEEALKNGQ